MKSKLPSTLLLVICASSGPSVWVSAQKVHWDGPEAKTDLLVGVINAQGTTNWIKFIPTASEGADSAAD